MTNPNNNWEAEGSFLTIQEAQIDDLKQVVDGLKSKGFLSVVAGDFNFIKDSEQYEKFVSLTQARDAFEDFSLPTYLLGRKSLKFLWRIKLIDRFFVFNAKPSGRVDYIFIMDDQNRIKITDTKHIFDEKVRLFNGKQSYLSDHIGLYARMEIGV